MIPFGIVVGCGVDEHGEYFVSAVAIIYSNMKRAHNHGVRIACGQDMPIKPPHHRQ